MSRYSILKNNNAALATSISTSKSSRNFHNNKNIILSSLLLTLYVFFGCCIRNTNAYASWLKCYVDLEEDDVIMNNKNIPHTKNKHFVHVQTNDVLYETIDDNTIKVHKGTNSVSLRLYVPTELEDEDVQYVMETTDSGYFGKYNPTTTDDDKEENENLPYVMCDGKRAFARNYDDLVKLNFNRTDEASNYVEIWAGWATGFEAVTITPKLKIIFDDDDGTATDSSKEEL